MKISMYLIRLPLLLLFSVTSSSVCFGVDYTQGEQALPSRMSTMDFFEDVDEKSFYQQKRIYGMKNELNNYSEKLHNLKERFDRIFYGLSSDGRFSTPFDTSSQPQRPVQEPIEPASLSFPPVSTSSGTIKENNPSVDELANDEEVNVTPPQNQLAFNVESPGEFTQNDMIVSTFDPEYSPAGGYYLILSPGIALPYEKHNSSKSYRKYDPGFSGSLASGLQAGAFRIGLGGIYKRHTFHHSARLHSSSLRLAGDSETFAGFLDLGYTFPLYTKLEANIGAGIGYYLSIIDDNRDQSSRKDHDLYLTLSSGLAWRFSEYFSMQLNYRYFHEDEVPAHLIELGLNFAL